MKRLKVGDKVPDFCAEDQEGNWFKLSDFKGKKCIIFFYPRANTESCTTEACNLRDNYAALRAAGYELVGVSDDSRRKQQNFRRKYSLPFPLLADTDRRVIDAFGVWGPKKFMGREYEGIHRTTFILDADAVILKVIEKVNTRNHAAQLLHG